MANAVLLIENRPSDHALFRDMAKAYGFSLDIALTGQDGINRVQIQRPTIIFCSVELPDLSGYFLCKKIKESPELRAIPLILLSSDPNAKTIFTKHQNLPSRATEYIVKPLTEKELVSAIEKYCEVTLQKVIPSPSHASVSRADHSSVSDELLQMREERDNLLFELQQRSLELKKIKQTIERLESKYGPVESIGLLIDQKNSEIRRLHDDISQMESSPVSGTSSLTSDSPDADVSQIIERLQMEIESLREFYKPKVEQLHKIEEELSVLKSENARLEKLTKNTGK